MEMRAKVDVDVVAVEQEDEVTVMVDVVAPTSEGATRPPATIEIVVDRSGSMHGGRLEAALRAIDELVTRLGPDDRLGVVTFDHDVEVALPAQPLGTKTAARQALRAIHPGGSTNLSGGLLRGLQEAHRVKDETGATLLLVSDGHANHGVVDPDRLAEVAATAAGKGVTTTTIGIGRGYDEILLSTIAKGGRGGHAFALDGDGAGAALAKEVDGLLERTAQAASLTIRPESTVESVRIWNDVPSTGGPDGIVAELGDLWSGETRTLLLTFAVPAKAELGLAKVATLEMRAVTIPDLREVTVTLEVHVNVVPGDAAAGRIPDAVVRSELLVQKAQTAKADAARRIAEGDIDGARSTINAVSADLSAAPAPYALDAELADLRQLQREMSIDERIAAKNMRAQQAARSRKRGRPEY